MMELIKTDKTEHRLFAPNIIHLRVKDGEEIDVPEVRKMREANLLLSKGAPFGVLLDARNHFTVTREARALLASEEFARLLLASAFVVRTTASKITGNFYIRFHKPANPTKLFSGEEEALRWLKEQNGTQAQ